jgi:radical SAM superfamily enzyme YgiQ (UPF0313 family)
MNILLMVPNFVTETSKKTKGHIPGITSPLFQVGAILNYNKYNVTAKDFSRNRNISFEDNIKYIVDNKFDVICIFIPSIGLYKSSLLYAEKIREINTSIQIYMYHKLSNMFTLEILYDNYADVVVLDEEDYITLDLISGKDLKDINGIAYKDNGKDSITYTKPFILPNNIDDLPSLSYGYEVIDDYLFKNGLYLVTSRGCMGQCTYCSIYHDKPKSIVYRDPDLVAEEIKYLTDKYGNIIDKYEGGYQGKFFDTNFTSSKEYIYKLMESFDKYNINLKWYCQTRVNCVDEQLLQSMKDHGCYGIIYGNESTNQDTLNFIKKGITLDQIDNTITISKKVGIKLLLNYIIGMPGDTTEFITNTINYISKIKPEVACFHIATPIPGTKLYDYCVENDLLLTKDWDLYNLRNQIIKLDDISDNKLEILQKTAYKMVNNGYTNSKENDYIFHIM